MSGAGEDWVGDEPRLWAVVRRILARAAHRRVLVVAVAALGAAAAVAWRTTRPPGFVASLTFVMAEGDVVDPRDLPKPPSRIREYVEEVALSRENLLALMEKHGLSRRLRALDPSAAVKSMRDDIDVDVSRNYFLLDRAPGDEPRSADIVITYTGDDREEARAVVHDLGALMLETQAASRARRLQAVREVDAVAARHERAHLQALRDARARLEAGASLADAAPSPRLYEEAAALQREIAASAGRLRKLEGSAASVELAADAEAKRLGMTFTLVDESVRSVRRRLGRTGAAAMAAAVLALLLPVVAVVVGAFDPKVRGLDDLSSRGRSLLGAVPWFPGADALAWRVRHRSR